MLVTNDRQDFAQLIEAADLHAGLVVLPLRKRHEQTAMFDRVIAYIEASAAEADEAVVDWMVNRVVEMDEQTGECSAYPLPESDRSRDR